MAPPQESGLKKRLKRIGRRARCLSCRHPAARDEPEVVHPVDKTREIAHPVPLPAQRNPPVSSVPPTVAQRFEDKLVKSEDENASANANGNGKFEEKLAQVDKISTDTEKNTPLAPPAADVPAAVPAVVEKKDDVHSSTPKLNEKEDLTAPRVFDDTASLQESPIEDEKLVEHPAVRPLSAPNLVPRSPFQRQFPPPLTLQTVRFSSSTHSDSFGSPFSHINSASTASTDTRASTLQFGKTPEDYVVGKASSKPGPQDYDVGLGISPHHQHRNTYPGATGSRMLGHQNTSGFMDWKDGGTTTTVDFKVNNRHPITRQTVNKQDGTTSSDKTVSDTTASMSSMQNRQPGSHEVLEPRKDCVTTSDVDVTTHTRDPVVHEEVKSHVHTIYQTQRTRDIHFHEHKTYIQPIADPNPTILPPEHWIQDGSTGELHRMSDDAVARLT